MSLLKFNRQFGAFQFDLRHRDFGGVARPSILQTLRCVEDFGRNRYPRSCQQDSISWAAMV